MEVNKLKNLLFAILFLVSMSLFFSNNVSAQTADKHHLKFDTVPRDLILF